MSQILSGILILFGTFCFALVSALLIRQHSNNIKKEISRLSWNGESTDKNIIFFQYGKSYIHSTGIKMRIVGCADTYIHGKCLIGEMENGELRTYRDWETDRKSTRLNSSHSAKSRMPSSA